MGRLKKVSAPKEELKDFAQVIESNLDALDRDSHNHTPRATAPGANDGFPGMMLPVGDYLYVKVSNSRWVRFSGTPI